MDLTNFPFWWYYLTMGLKDFFNFRRRKMPLGIKQISKREADALVACAEEFGNAEQCVLQLNGKFYDITEAEPLDIAEFIQLERFKKLQGNKSE